MIAMIENQSGVKHEAQGVGRVGGVRIVRRWESQGGGGSDLKRKELFFAPSITNHATSIANLYRKMRFALSTAAHGVELQPGSMLEVEDFYLPNRRFREDVC